MGVVRMMSWRDRWHGWKMPEGPEGRVVRYMSGSGWWNGWIERVGRPRRRRMKGRRWEVPEVRDVRSTSRRDPGLERRRGSAHRIRIVAVESSILCLPLSWSKLRRRRPGAGYVEAPLVSATIFEGSTLDLIGWRYDQTTETGSKVFTALLFEHAACVECPGCLSHQTVGSRVLERAVMMWCVVERNVRATGSTGEIFSLS